LSALLATGARAQNPLGEGVPYIRTPQAVVDKMLDLAAVGPDDFLIDLGSGDGRIVITAAKKLGTRGLGVEIDPRLVEQSRDAARGAGVADRAQFVVQDLFDTDLRQADVLTMYLLPDVNLALRPRILAGMKPGSRVVSHDWDMGDWAPDARIRLEVPDKKLGLKKESVVYLWMVPARMAGVWRSSVRFPDGPMQVEFRIEQKFQELSGRAISGARSFELARAFTHGAFVFFQFGEGREALRFQGHASNERVVGQVFDADGRSYPWRALKIN
jgi:hypothetical protein